MTGGKAFDFCKTSTDYAKYRNIYPESFYEKIASLGLCTNGQKVLDAGTGTGVLPRFMKKCGAQWTEIDISENQIKEAERLSNMDKNGKNCQYFVRTAEETGFNPSSFDVITACQCYWYFNHERAAKEFSRILKPAGKLLLLEMNWLPFEDKIAGKSENLVLKYNPAWNEKGNTLKPLSIPPEYEKYFTVAKHEEWKLPVHFTRESWNGRMKSCRGTGASLSAERLSQWEKEHLALLKKSCRKNSTFSTMQPMPNRKKEAENNLMVFTLNAGGKLHKLSKT